MRLKQRRDRSSSWCPQRPLNCCTQQHWLQRPLWLNMAVTIFLTSYLLTVTRQKAERHVDAKNLQSISCKGQRVKPLTFIKVLTFILAANTSYSMRIHRRDWYQLWRQDFWIPPQVASAQIPSQRRKSQRMEQQMTKNPWGKAKLPNEAPSPRTKMKPRTMNTRGKNFRDVHTTVGSDTPLGIWSCHWGSVHHWGDSEHVNGVKVTPLGWVWASVTNTRIVQSFLNN